MKKYCIIFALFFATNFVFSQSNYQVSTARQKTQIDTLFPFDLTLRRPDSSVILSSEILKKGKPTVLAFWLTTCYPCRIEFGEYQKNWENWNKEIDFNFVAVSTDFSKNFKQIGVMAATFPWPTVWDFNREFCKFLPGGLNGLPQVFLFDADGKLVYQHRKFVPGDEFLLFAELKKLKI
jgi:cytochrome c biogenesis protein CcmG, thiol:disulfide interchange protein DsbE